MWKVPAIFNPINEELKTVFNKLESLLHPNAKALIQKLNFLGYEWAIPPSLTLLSARLYSKTEFAIMPALFMELIYLATTLHHLPQHKKNCDSSLMILGGDYLYSHLFYLLCKFNCFSLSERLSRLISEMMEGLVQKTSLQQTSKLTEEFLYSIKKQYGNFFGEACALGCLFAEGDEQNQKVIYKFGYNLGIAYGIKESYADLTASYFYLEQAINSLSPFSDSEEGDLLEKIACGIVLYPLENENYAVI